MIHGCNHHDYEDISINHCFDLLNKPHNIHGPGAGSKEVGLVLNGTLEDAGPDASHLDQEAMMWMITMMKLEHRHQHTMPS